MIKKFSHKNPETCLLCKKEIKVNSDEWAALNDLDGRKIALTKFYHRKCLVDLLEGKGKVIQKNFEEKLKNFTSKMFGKLNIDPSQLEIGLGDLSS